MRVIVLGLLLATPLAAAATFLPLPAPASEASACGGEACFFLGPDDRVVQVHGGRGYAFLATDGLILDAGILCHPAFLDVPAGAASLVVDPAPCA